MTKRKQPSRSQAQLTEAQKERQRQIDADKLWLWCYRKLAKCKSVSEVIIPLPGRRPLRIKIDHPEDGGGNSAA
jgi:hypothetical protein